MNEATSRQHRRAQRWRAHPLALLGTILTVVAVLAVSACGDDDDQVAEAVSSAGDEAEEGEGESGTNGDAPDDTSGSDGSESGSSSEDCEPGPGKKITELDEVTIPEVHEPERVVDDAELGGETIPGFVVPEVHIPEHTVDTGCIVEYEAPGGCLGKVVITGYEIPEVEVPGYEIPEVVASDGEVLFDGVEVDPVKAEAVAIEGATADEVCQQEPPDGEGLVASVLRPSILRPSALRASLLRASALRPRICVDDAGCVDSERISSMRVSSVRVASQRVSSERLSSYRLDGTEGQVFEEDEQTAYLAPADVLFEFDKSELRPDAVSTLETIAGAIETGFPADATITVEGHTDSEGEEDYNQTLSEDRAKAVAAWLVDEGGLDSDKITTAGYGETLPVASNEDDEGRAQNRRVVITVSAE